MNMAYTVQDDFSTDELIVRMKNAFLFQSFLLHLMMKNGNIYQ